MDNIKEMAKLVAHYIKGEEKKTKAYDTAAKVKRIDNGIAYVEIPGGVDETPVKLTIDAKKGDTVQVRVANGTAWLVGNRTAPPTDDAEAIVAKTIANSADYKASNAMDSATIAKAAADEAVISAATAKSAADDANDILDDMEAAATAAGTTLEGIYADAETAKTNAQTAITNAGLAQTAANEAKASALNANEYASRALANLSTVESVAETLTWVTEHGTMTLTTDVTLDPTHVYFVREAGGDYHVGSYYYNVVVDPDVADIGSYYELTIDESLQNYVGTHLALDSEGLWLLPAASGTNKVLIATGAGGTYTTAGTYIIDSGGNTVASFRANGATIGSNSTFNVRLSASDLQFYNQSALLAYFSAGLYPTLKILGRYGLVNTDLNPYYLQISPTDSNNDTLGRVDIMAPVNDGDNILRAEDINGNALVDLYYDQSNAKAHMDISGNITTTGNITAGDVNIASGKHYKINGTALAASDVGALPDYTLSIHDGTGGNPRVVKFCTIDYSACDSNNGVFIKIGMRAGHGNGSSYNELEDVMISVDYSGTVNIDIYRYYAASVTYDGTTHYYGDVLYTNDTTNKVVKCYVLMGQYSDVYMQPYAKLNGSSKGTITQHTGTSIKDLSGAYTFGNVFWLDGRTKQDILITGTNIKTINGSNVLGSGNLTVTDSSKLPLTGGQLTGDTELYGTDAVFGLKAPAATNSPILRFQRGTLDDNYNDWQIQDRGGYLYFDERGQGSTTWTNRAYIDTSGVIYASYFSGSGSMLTGVQSTLSTETISPTITASTGTTVSTTGRQYGNIITLQLQFRNTSSTASGSNLYVGSISQAAYKPPINVTGATYYGSTPLIGMIDTTGAITIRNASASALTIGSSYSATITWTYLV